MGSYLSGFYYETSQDSVSESLGSDVQDSSSLPREPSKLAENSRESSGIHQKRFKTQRPFYLMDTEKQLGLEHMNDLGREGPCLDEKKTLKAAVFKKSPSESLESCNRNFKTKFLADYNPSKGLHLEDCTTESIVVCSKEVEFGVNLLQNRTESKNQATSSSDQVPSSCAWEIDMGGFFVNKKRRKQAKSSKAKEIGKGNKHSNEDPSNVTSSYTDAVAVVTKEIMALRKVFDQRRCLRPISQEEALTVLGFKPPFGEIRFGPFTGNATLMRWFHQLCNQYKVRGRAYYLYKPKGKNRTVGITSNAALGKLKQGLQDEQTAVIYHCHNHYFCPVGYEDTPTKAVDAYRTVLPSNQTTTWVLVCDPSSKHPVINSIRWSDIDTDLNCENPFHMNIRKLHNGVIQRKTKKVGGNLHCLMAFQRSTWQGVRRNMVVKYPEPPCLDNTPGMDSESEESTEDSDD